MPRGTPAARVDPGVAPIPRRPRGRRVEVRDRDARGDGRRDRGLVGRELRAGAAAGAAAAGRSAGASAPVAAAAAAGAAPPVARSRATCSFVSGPQRYDIAQRVASSRGALAFAETSRNWRLPRAADRLVERRDVGRPRGRAEALEHARLVVLRLQAPDEPRAGVRHRLVVEVDRVLGREHEPEPEGAALLEDRQDRLLRGRRRRSAARSRTPRPCRRAPAGRACPPGRAST